MKISTDSLHVRGDHLEFGRFASKCPDRELLLLTRARAVQEAVGQDILGDDRGLVEKAQALVPATSTCKLLPPSLIKCLENPLPRFIEDMGASGGHELFVDALFS